MTASSRPVHFATAARFRAWLEKNHAHKTELHVLFYKKGSGRGGMSYRESVDEALCFGWIDGVMHRIDETSYAQRFTPRKPGSTWSNINVGNVARLPAAGKMHPAGIAAFAARDPEKTGIYAFERTTEAKLSPACLRRFRENTEAWQFFNAQPAGYRRLMIHKIVSPRQPATRERWLQRVIAASAAKQRIE